MNKKTEIIKVEPLNLKPFHDALPSVNDLLDMTAKLKIVDQKSYDASAEVTPMLKRKKAGLIAQRKDLTDPIDVARKRAMDLFRGVIEALDEEIERQNAMTVVFEKEQERIRKAEEDKARAAAEKKESDARKKADEEREKAEVARKAGDEAAAAKAEAKADKAEEKADNTVMPSVAPKFDRPAGISMRDNWKARTIPGKEHLIPRPYMMPDQKKLDKQAKATKNTMKIEGIEFYNEPIPARRS